MIAQKKQYGGGIIDLENNKLPIGLKYLFENKYIECMQIMIILFLNRKKRKGLVFEEILYYFTLLISTTEDNDLNYYVDNKYIQNNYLSYEEKIRDDLIILCNHNFIDIKIEILKKKNEMYIKLTDQGKTTIDTLENEYYEQLIKKCEYLIEYRKFNNKNQKGVLIGDED